MESHRMKHSTKNVLLIIVFGALLLCHTRDAQAQKAGAAATMPLITSTRVAVSEGVFWGPLYATIDGKEKKIADEAIQAWIIQGGRQVVYSGRDGAGGFENEGQSLRVYDARTGKHRKIMSEYVAVDKVTEATTSQNKTALIVAMSDGGLGASYLAVVDPERGEVFFRRWAKLISHRGDIIVIGHYKEDDWDKFLENENAKVTPYKTERQNLNIILRRRVILNKPDR